MLENSTDKNESCMIYASVACMSSNAEIPRKYFRDISQLTNWILDSDDTCHMKPEISDFISGSLVETDNYIEVADGNFVTVKQKGEIKIKMRNDNENPFIATLYNVLFAPDLCDL